MQAEDVLVGDVVADVKPRLGARKLQQPQHRRALVHRRRRQQVEHHLAGDDARGRPQAGEQRRQLGRGPDGVPRLPVVDRQRQALVFEQQARVERPQRLATAPLGQPGPADGDALRRLALGTRQPIDAVIADRVVHRHPQAAQDILARPAADHRGCADAAQAVHRRPRARRRDDLLGPQGDRRQRAVEVERGEDAPAAQPPQGGQAGSGERVVGRGAARGRHTATFRWRRCNCSMRAVTRSRDRTRAASISIEPAQR